MEEGISGMGGQSQDKGSTLQRGDHALPTEDQINWENQQNHPKDLVHTSPGPPP